MKKFILGLFLILGAVSFAVPSFIDATKLQKSGHSIIQDEANLFTIGSPKEDTALVILERSFLLSFFDDT